VAGHKTFKELARRENLRDHMRPIELALRSLGEATAIELHRDRDSGGPGMQGDRARSWSSCGLGAERTGVHPASCRAPSDATVGR